MRTARAIGGVGVLAVLGCVLAKRYLTRMTVVGHSMSPTLRDGQRVWLQRPSPRHRYVPGEIIAFEHQRGHGSPPMLVKRVSRVDRGDAITGLIVRGDGVRSLDSRHLGAIPVSSVRGIVRGGR